MTELRFLVREGRNAMPTGGEAKILYALVEASVSGVEQSVPMHLAILLDVSGSMQENGKLEKAKEALIHVVRNLRPQDHLSIMTFDYNASTVWSGNVASETMREGLIRQIRLIEAGGGTHMGQSIADSLRLFGEYIHPQASNHMILVSDGQTQDGAEDWCIAQCRDAAERHNLSTSTIGLGADFNEKLLTSMADASRGKAHYIADASDIPAVLAKELASSQSASLLNTRLTINLSRGVELYRVSNYKPQIGEAPMSHGDRMVEIAFGDLKSGESRAVLLELQVPPRHDGTFRVAHLRFTGDQLVACPEHDMVLLYHNLFEYPVNPEVMIAVDQVSVWRQQTRALELAAQGETVKATRLLRAAGTTLLEQGRTELGQAAFNEAERLECGAGLSADVKKLTFGTRLLS